MLFDFYRPLALWTRRPAREPPYASGIIEIRHDLTREFFCHLMVSGRSFFSTLVPGHNGSLFFYGSSLFGYF